ncbi:MAG TPA: tetratricopeptide repeat protein [Acidobacteriota bacterium]|nr:tetratricopeptide repeat protein [Acidobacteriota bacterium]
MPQSHPPALIAMCLVLLTSLSSPPSRAQTTDEKSRPSGPPIQKEDIPQAPALPSWSISEDARTLIANALKTGNYELAENTLTKLVEQYPKSPHILTFLARIFLMDNKPLNCSIAMKKAERVESLKEPDQFTLALCFVGMRKTDWASEEFVKLAQSNPKNALYPYWQGRIAYDNYAFESAVEKFNKALELDPGFTRAYDNLGLCYEGMSNNELALKYYERAVDLNRKQSPASPWPPLNYGTLLLRQGALDQAEPVLRESVALGPRLPQTHHQLGILLGKQKRFTDAADELKKAIELDPTYPEAHFTLAHVYRQLGEPARAEAELSIFQKLKQAPSQK